MYVGIDVSKATFSVAYSSSKSEPVRTFKNTAVGIHGLIRSLPQQDCHCVMEATGNYSALLVYMLTHAGITTSLENPLKIKHFSRAMLSVVKTDESDARLIALYGERMHPAPYKSDSDTFLTIKQKRTVIRQLRKHLLATRNLEGSMQALPFLDKKSKRIMERTEQFLQAELQQAEKDLADLAESEYAEQIKLLTSVKGIGMTVATALIMITGGFTYFENAKQLTRFLGLSPTYEYSGTSVHRKGHINRNGDPQIRSQIYVATMSSLRCNQACKAFYERLRADGKPGKVAVVATANKLIRQAFAIVKSGIPYQDEYVPSRTYNHQKEEGMPKV